MKYLSDIGINKAPENGDLDVDGDIYSNGVKINLDDTGWIAVGGGTGFSYRKIGNIVYLNGYAAGIEGSGVVTMFTLPVGFRPSGAGVALQVRVDQGFTSYNWADINTGGAVRISKTTSGLVSVLIGGSFAI